MATPHLAGRYLPSGLRVVIYQAWIIKHERQNIDTGFFAAPSRAGRIERGASHNPD
jgi:hypothetical protein